MKEYLVKGLHLEGSKNLVCDLLSRVDAKEDPQDIQEIWNAQMKNRVMVAYTRGKRKLDDAPIEILHDKEDFEAIISKKKRQEELQCDHGEDYTINRKGRFLRIIRNVGKENVDPQNVNNP